MAIKHATTLKIGLNILRKWSCTDEQIKAILALSDSFLRPVSERDIKLTDEQLIRFSYVTCIHVVLKTMFTNEKNVYGFMQMINNNKFFEGATPLDKIESGDLDSLRLTYNNINELIVSPYWHISR